MRATYSTLSLAVAALVFLSSCGGGKDAAVKSYDIGAKVEIGHLIYTVFETQWLPQLGAGNNARVPKNRFFIIRLSTVNSGSEELLVPNAILKDDQGNTVEELTDGSGVTNWIGYVRKVKPADSLAGNIVFDAEPKHYSLQLSDENSEKIAIVDLPLNFNAETPQLLPTPGANPNGGTSSPAAPPKK